MPFNPDTATCPEETHPDADWSLYQSHCFLEEVPGDIVKRAKARRRDISLTDLTGIMEACEDAIHDQTKAAVDELSETYPDTSATPDDWKQKLEAAASHINNKK